LHFLEEKGSSQEFICESKIGMNYY